MRPQIAARRLADERHRHHHDLGRDDAGRHQDRRPVLQAVARLLADQRQHRRVGEMEQDHRGGEDRDPAVLEQLGDADGLTTPSLAVVGSRARSWSMSASRISRTATALAAAMPATRRNIAP